MLGFLVRNRIYNTIVEHRYKKAEDLGMLCCVDQIAALWLMRISGPTPYIYILTVLRTYDVLFLVSFEILLFADTCCLRWRGGS